MHNLPLLLEVESIFKVAIFIYKRIPNNGDDDDDDDDDGDDDNDSASSVVDGVGGGGGSKGVKEGEGDNRNRDIAMVVRRSPRSCTRYTRVNFDLYQNHVSVIRDLNVYKRLYRCAHTNCSALFKRVACYHRHLKTCQKHSPIRYVGGGYQPAPTLFQRITEHVGGAVDIPELLRYDTLFGVYDGETIGNDVIEEEGGGGGAGCSTSASDTTTTTPTITSTSPGGRGSYTMFTKRLELISMAVSSSVEGFQTAEFFRTRGDQSELMRRVIFYLLRVSRKAEEIRLRALKPVLDHMEMKRQQFIDGGQKRQARKCSSLITSLLQHCSRLITFGYNSSRVRRMMMMMMMIMMMMMMMMMSEMNVLIIFSVRCSSRSKYADSYHA
jgi:hypothetical protein